MLDSVRNNVITLDADIILYNLYIQSLNNLNVNNTMWKILRIVHYRMCLKYLTVAMLKRILKNKYVNI